MIIFSFHGALGKTLLISDIDDTVKLADVPSLVNSARYALDSESRFAGMAALYELIVQASPDTSVHYLSNAPTWLMEDTHLDFLSNGKFPEGTYYGRSEDSAAYHKLNRLREIFAKEKPDRVIFFGDNGENDALFYSMIQSEFAPQGIEFITFIRLITRQPLQPRQVAFVTPIEVALELQKRNAIKAESVQWLVENVLPFLVTQRNLIDTGVVSFPGYVNCADFKWSWDQFLPEYPALGSLKTRISQKCGSR